MSTTSKQRMPTKGTELLTGQCCGKFCTTQFCPDCGKRLEGRGPQRIVTVRMPAALHAALDEAARQQRTSVNLLCVRTLAEGISFTPGAAGDSVETENATQPAGANKYDDST